MVLVTGATGHLGSHVLYELTKSNKFVRAIYRDEKKKAFVRKVFSYYQADYSGLLDKIEWVKADINDLSGLTNCMHNIDQVYHTAGLVSFNDKDRKRLYHVNIDGTSNVVNACLEAGVGKLCYVSSIAVFGELNTDEPTHENVIWNQGTSASAYAISKYRGEMEVWRGFYEGLNTVIVNPSVIIGPGMWMGPAKQLFESIYKGLNYYPPGSSGYVDVRDVARAMLLLTEGQFTGERFILNAANITHQYYLNLLADAMGRPRPGHVITPLFAKIAVIAETIFSALKGAAPRINKRTLEIASERLAYSNTRIIDKLGIAFTPIEESVQFLVQQFLLEMQALYNKA